MDFSQIIQGTRQFFQGHPGKSIEDTADGELQLIETKCVFKKNEPYSFNSTSYSDVMKLNYPVQSSSQYYPRLYCEQITYQQKVSSSYQINEACAVDVGSKYASCAEPNISQITHKPTFQYEEHNWKNNILPKLCESSPKLPFSQVPTFSTATNTNRNFTYQQQHQVSVNTNEFIVPARSYFHRGHVPETANISQYSEIVLRQPFVQSTEIVSRKQSSTSTNVCQTQRSRIPCPENTNSKNFRDQNGLLRQTENSSDFSRDCVFNRNYTLSDQSNEQQWDHKISSISIANHKDMRSAYPQEQFDISENGEVNRPLQNPSQQNCHSRELSKKISQKCAFIPYASVGTETLFHSSTNYQPDQTTHLSESSAKIKSSIGRDLCGVSVIQHSMNNPTISVGSIPKNEERMSVISYPRQRGLDNEKSFTNHNSDTKSVQFHAVPINIVQPKKEPCLFGCNSVCPNIPSSSANQSNGVYAKIVTAAKAVNKLSSQLVKQSPNKATKPNKLIVKSFGNSPVLIPTSNSVLIATTLTKSDPIVSDEKWEEWKSSFDTEWNAFVKDLANSRNIKRIHRISQPIPHKIKRREHTIPHKSSSDFKPSKIEHFASDEDIPLSLRRKVKEEQ